MQASSRWWFESGQTGTPRGRSEFHGNLYALIETRLYANTFSKKNPGSKTVFEPNQLRQLSVRFRFRISVSDHVLKTSLFLLKLQVFAR